MLEPLAERTVIIGNSGSGKSTLAEAVASLVHIPVIDLDLLHWEEDGYGVKRNEDVARKMALDVSNQPRWVIEGAFGWLAEVALPKATALIWLDFPWSLCRAGLLARGLRRGATSRDAAELMKWAEAYSADIKLICRSFQNVQRFLRYQIEVGEPRTSCRIAR